MSDLESIEDIKLLVDTFYSKVLQDQVIGKFFTSVVQLDWDKHIPVMYNFWTTVLLSKGDYKGNPMLKHIALHKKESLEAAHFERWLSLWRNTVSDLFSGEKANEAIQKAEQLALLMQYKIGQSGKQGFIQ